MKSITVLISIIVAASACTPSHKGLEEIARNKMDAMNSHNLAVLGTFYADSAKIKSVGFEKTEIGPAGIRGVYERYFASTPDLKFTITQLTISEQSVVIEYTSSGTMVQSEQEAKIPDYFVGKKYVLQNSTRMDVENGKIVREMTYFDQVAFLRQMGFFDPH